MSIVPISCSLCISTQDEGPAVFSGLLFNRKKIGLYVAESTGIRYWREARARKEFQPAAGASSSPHFFLQHPFKSTIVHWRSSQTKCTDVEAIPINPPHTKGRHPFQLHSTTPLSPPLELESTFPCFTTRSRRLRPNPPPCPRCPLQPPLFNWSTLGSRNPLDSPPRPNHLHYSSVDIRTCPAAKKAPLGPIAICLAGCICESAQERASGGCRHDTRRGNPRGRGESTGNQKAALSRLGCYWLCPYCDIFHCTADRNRYPLH